MNRRVVVARRYNPAMRRLARWTLNALTVLSLLLCAGSVAAWAWSYRQAEEVALVTPRYGLGVAYSQGEVSFEALRLGVPAVESLRLMHFAPGSELDAEFDWPYGRSWVLIGFGAGRSADGMVAKTYTYALFAPGWAVSLGLLAVTVYLWAKRNGRGSGTGCRFCSYDLTGNVSGVCPECGTAIVKGDG
jgi:hypothetical protein